METSQASNKLSVQISGLKDLIVALGAQVAQVTSELMASKDELIATNNDLIAAENEFPSKDEPEALKAELTAIIQTQLLNIRFRRANRHRTPHLLVL